MVEMVTTRPAAPASMTKIWSSVAVFPWLEGSFRYTRIYHVPGFEERPGSDFGDFKDKSFDLKAVLLPERGWWPAVALGYQDAGGGTGVFRAPDGKTVYVKSGNATQVIDVATWTIRQELNFGPKPGGASMHGIVVTPDGQRVIASVQSDLEIARVGVLRNRVGRPVTGG
jgi:DNA-binding beta-propeller fold protein YncE